MIDLEYDPTSFAGPVDMRVVRIIENYCRHQFDSSYLEYVKQFHGGVPGKQYFNASNGVTYRLGRFLTLVDEKSELEPPFRQSWEFRERDIRIDWSVYTHIFEDGPNCRGLFENLWPFARLYFGDHHPDEMGTSEAGVVDLVCFFYEVDSPCPRVVVWLALKAFYEYIRWEKAGCDDVRYADFTVPVAANFEEFLKLLHREP